MGRIGGMISVAVATLSIAAAALAAAGDLTPAGCVEDNDAGPDDCVASTDGLSGANWVAVSDDGRSVYAASLADNAITRFDRDPATGAIAAVGCVEDDDVGPDGCTATAPGLEGAQSVAVSDGGTSVYATSRTDDAIVRFDRDSSGALTPAGCIDDNDTGPDTCAATADGLDDARAVAVSRDGLSVYVASLTDSAIVRFDRDPSGALTPAGCIDDNDTGPDACVTSVDGLNRAIDLAVSRDGLSVYAVSLFDDAIVRFDRNPTTGALSPAGCIDDNDTGADSCAASTDGLDGANSVAISADGRSVYVGGGGDDAVVAFDRDAAGALTPAGCIDDNDTGADVCGVSIDGLDGADATEVSPDGRSVYAGGFTDDAIVVLGRDPETRALSPAGCINDNDTGVDSCSRSADGIHRTGGIAISADGRSVYGVSGAESAITRFDRELYVDPAPGEPPPADPPAADPPPADPPQAAADSDPPETTITKKPKKRTGRRKGKFRFESDELDSTFQCKIDKKAYQACSSPFKKVALRYGKHRFRVHAVDAAGNADPTDAAYRWKVRRPG